MRLAFVIPWLARTGGNKISLHLAEELVSRGDQVELFVHTASLTVLPQLPEVIPNVPVQYIRARAGGFANHLDPIAWNVAPRRDKDLAALIARRHRELPFDAVILFSNEGRSIARNLRRILRSETPSLGWCLMELIDHSFLLRHERDLPWLRSIALPLYPFIHELWKMAYEDQDFLLTNSPWTSELLEYLYGFISYGDVILLPRRAFLKGPQSTGPLYLAVPTVSLGRRESKLLAELSRTGLPLVAYGPRPPSPSLSIPYRGFLSEDAMRGFLSGAAATLFLFDYEALGLVPFESLAAGTPVITLPKQGPYRTLHDNSHVKFGRNSSELFDLCVNAIDSPPTEDDREACRHSVENYRSPVSAERFRRLVEQVIRPQVRPRG